MLLAAHRELNDNEVDTTELEAHLEQCPSCREALARFRFVGEQVRALPPVEPSLNLYTKLMQALAEEHTRFMQKSPSAVPAPPEFLKPYMQAYADTSPSADSLTAFSTADTGPLPVLPVARKHKKRQPALMGHFAVIGLAAVFFIALMMGGITSLLLLAQNHVAEGPSSNSASILHPTDVVAVTYTSNTVYDHVVSAVADNTSIYYTAYGDGKNDGWMLERLDRATKISTPLLSQPSASPLIVLGSANGWLVWLQFDTPQAVLHKNTPLPHAIRTWSLYYLSIAPRQPESALILPAPVTLLSGTFDSATAPDWIYSPIQGIWFMQDKLLVAAVDNAGVSRLLSFSLGTTTKENPPSTVIATASSGRIITSPTANSDGSQVYWAQEWQTSDGNLHSDIWTQQAINLPRPTRGWATQRTITVKEPFLADGMSFHPVVVDNTLFFLSTAGNVSLAQGKSAATPVATATGSRLPAITPNTGNLSTPWAENAFYPAPLDSGVRGTIYMYAPDDAAFTAPMALSQIGTASALQAGKDFVLWQNAEGYGMYDAATRTDITVGETLNGAEFLAVNGDTTAWMVSSQTNTPGAVSPAITLKVFNWPK